MISNEIIKFFSTFAPVETVGSLPQGYANFQWVSL